MWKWNKINPIAGPKIYPCFSGGGKSVNGFRVGCPRVVKDMLLGSISSMFYEQL
jgi:hypothetical protein